MDSVSVFLCTFRLFKYFDLNPHFGVMWRVLQLAANTLLTFVLLLVTFFFGFVFMGYVCFGGHLEDYITVHSSLNAVVQMVLGTMHAIRFELPFTYRHVLCCCVGGASCLSLPRACMRVHAVCVRRARRLLTHLHGMPYRLSVSSVKANSITSAFPA